MIFLCHYENDRLCSHQSFNLLRLSVVHLINRIIHERWEIRILPSCSSTSHSFAAFTHFRSLVRHRFEYSLSPRAHVHSLHMTQLSILFLTVILPLEQYFYLFECLSPSLWNHLIGEDPPYSCYAGIKPESPRPS